MTVYQTDYLEVYAMAQASKAILPRDVNGPFGSRIGVSIGGSLNWALRVNAFVTGRVNPSDWLRYSIVVLNWDDSASTSWNPQPVTATIEFRGKQATYTFPLGVTTLWWYAPSTSSAQVVGNAGNFTAEDDILVHGSTQIPLSTTSQQFANETATAHNAHVTERDEPLFRFRRSL